MNNSNYRLACGYARKLTKIDPIDLVHDTFISFYNKKGQNLFNQPPKYICVCIKNTWSDRIRNQTRQYVGFYGKHRKYDQPHVRGPRYGDFPTTSLVSYQDPEQEYIAKEKKELVTKLIKGSKEKYSDILKLKMEGYRNVEIGQELNISKELVNYYMNKSNLKHILN